jgi:hypothetical protein
MTKRPCTRKAAVTSILMGKARHDLPQSVLAVQRRAEGSSWQLVRASQAGPQLRHAVPAVCPLTPMLLHLHEAY